MNSAPQKNPFIAIACGGTGGHLFPGLAVAEQLKQRGCDVALLISPKDVDQQAVKSALGMEVFTLPAVGLQNRNYFSFAKSFWNSFCTARKIFKSRKPDAVLAMGGFTSAPPVLAVRKFGAKTFLHESNTIPGKANRFLARFVDEAFVGFPEAAARLRAKKTSVTGTPVRPQFQLRAAEISRSEMGFEPNPEQKPWLHLTQLGICRTKLGLEANRPTVLVVGGSQGASGLNEMILSALPLLARCGWQWLHLTGANDFEKVKAAYDTHGIKAVVKPFFTEMDLALGVATVAVSRSGASSLAEIAAMRLPSLLVPYPAAADNHQFFNARAFEKTDAAKLLEQKNSTPKKLLGLLRELVENSATREEIKTMLAAQWHTPKAAGKIAENILSAISRGADQKSFSVVPPVAERGATNLKAIA